MKRPAVFLAAALSVLLIGRAAALDEHPTEDKPSDETKRAASLVLGQLTNYLTDVKAMSSMSDAEKIAYIKDKAAERVTEHVLAADVKVINDGMDEFLKKSVEYYAYSQTVDPILAGARATGARVDLAALEAKSASLADTKIAVLKGAWAAGKLTGAALKAVAEDGPMGGVKVVGGAIAEKLAEYYIPGFGWIKAGADLSQALIEYILDYANQAAKDGIIDLLYPEMKEDPKTFWKWLAKTEERAIGLDVKARWDEMNPDVGHFTFAKTPEGQAEMRDLIRKQLFSLRTEILKRQKEDEEATKEIRWKLQMKVYARRAAEDKLREAAEKAQADKTRLLIKIDEFKELYLGLGNAKRKAQDIANESKKFTYNEADASGNVHTVTAEDNVVAVFHPMSLTLESLKPAVAKAALELDRDEAGPAFEAIENQLTGDYQKQDKLYDDDYSRTRGEGVIASHFYNDLTRYRELTKSNYDELRQQTHEYRYFLDKKSQETFGRLMTAIGKRHRDAGALALPSSLDDMVKGLEATPELSTTLRAPLTRDMIPGPRYDAVQHGTWFGPLWGALRNHVWDLENEKRRIERTLEQIDESLGWAEKAPENKVQIQALAAEALVLARQVDDSDTIINRHHRKNLETLGMLDDAWAKPLVSHLDSLTASVAQLKRKRPSWASALEDVDMQIASEKRMMARLDRAGAVLGSISTVHPREQLTRWTVDCSVNVPGFIYFARQGGQTCTDLAKDPTRYLTTKTLEKAQAKLIADLRSSGILALDADYKLGLEDYVNAVVPSYFENPAELGDGMAFVEFGKSCCFFKASYFKEEAVKLAALDIKTGADGDGYDGRLVGAVHFGEALANTDFWADHTNAGCGPLQTPTAKDALVAAAIPPYCAAVAKQAKLYREYKDKAKVKKALEKEIDALADKVNKVNSAAVASMKADDYKKVLEYESEVAAMKTKVKDSKDLYADHQEYILGKLSPLEGNMATAKTMSQMGNGTAVTTTGGGTPGGPGGGQQPSGPQTGGQQPGGQQPGSQQPVGQQPGGQQPGGQQPGGQQPGGQQAGAQKPGSQTGGGASGPSAPGMPSTSSPKPTAALAKLPAPKDDDEAPMNRPPAMPGGAGPAKSQEQSDVEAVKAMYADFQKAYVAKSVSQVLRYVSPDWEAGDGTSISDLQTSLNGTFSVFNELKCSLTNIQVSKSSSGRYKVTYEMAITGRIFAQNIKHEEKSTVTEEVAFENGRPVIARTVTGNFWYFE